MADKIAEMKRLMVEALLERQGRCFLQVVPSAAEEGLGLPSEYIERDSCTLALNTGTQSPGITEWGVEVATQFGGRPFVCSVPWSAVIQVLDPEQKGAVLAWLFPVQDREEGPEEDGSGSVGDAEGETGEGARGEQGGKARRSGHLKVIK